MKRRLASGIVFLLLAAVLVGGLSLRADAASSLLGDVNGDGKISAIDYLLLKRHVLRRGTLSAKAKMAGDVNEDGKISALDFVMVKRHVLKTYDLHTDHTYDGHLFLTNRNKGSCRSLVGRVSVLLVFVNDCESAWDNATMEVAQRSLCNEILRLGAYAESAGANLSLEYGEAAVAVEVDVESHNASSWETAVANAMGFATVYDLQLYYEKAWNVDSVPVVFLLNKTGRAAAYSSAVKTGGEYLAVYSSDYSTFCHEILHLYGARDYYFPAAVSAAAGTYLQDSIMSNGKTVDSLTAYTVGWTDTLTMGAKGFLDTVAFLTREDLEAAAKAESFTGYGSKLYPNGDEYLGDLELGVPHGTGEYRFAAGGVYSGEFVWGAFQGVGRMEWPSGEVYEGDFVNNVRNGQGIYWFANGDRYEGGFLEGKLHGFGIYYHASGEEQNGYWEYGIYRSDEK